MSTSFVDAKEPSKQDKGEDSMVKYKLRISLIFRTIAPSQKTKAKDFRNNEKGEEALDGNDLAQELSGGQICYSDKDDGGEYIIEDKTFVVDEGSPKAMNRLSKSIDNYIKGICLKSDVEKVVPCIFIPSISDTSIVPKLFFQLYAPNCILKEEQKGIYKKIDNNKGYIYFFGFDVIESYLPTEPSDVAAKNGELSKMLIQLAALISYYTYIYIDVIEQKDWIVKKSMTDEKIISDAWEEYVRSKQSKESLWVKAGKTFFNVIFHPIDTIKGTFDFLFNYSGHLQNRLFTRIFDVIYISCKPETMKNDAIKAVHDIFKGCKENRRPIDMFSFFDKCNYWNYLQNNNLRDSSAKWEVLDDSEGLVSFLTGYGAILLSNGKDYFYGFKGTDFDSYAKDWLMTNLVQGLTGFSFQHLQAASIGSSLDKQIGSKGKLWFVGHSLGGGLASAATIATKAREGITFNAAGLNVIGVKGLQLLKNMGGIFHPSQSWNRVHPFRIKGEVLDTTQKTVLRALTLGTLERGYGKKSVDYEISIDGERPSCATKHGINNFLYKDVIEKLAPFDEVKDDNPKPSKNNKVSNITIIGKEGKLSANL